MSNKKGRKPIPKTQREISENLQTPLTPGGVGFQPTGNPNDLSITKNPNEQATGIGFNRSTKFSFTDDTVKPFTVGIEDIDNAVFYYFQNVIKPYVIQNSQRIEVPIIYGSPERWKSVQKDGYYRDKLNKVMLPLIMFKRNDITKDRSVANKLDANFPNLYVSWKKQYSNRNFYSNFGILNNRVPEREYYANVVPDYVTVTYECMIMTYYMDQMNKIVEAINYASDSYWGDPSRYKFKASIDTFNAVTELSTDQDRIVRSTFNIKLNGYIVPDVVQKDLTALKKLPSISKVTFTLETAESAETFGLMTKAQPMKSIPATFFDNVAVLPGAGGGGGGNIDPETLTYLNTNVQLTGTYVSSNVFVFNKGFLPSPIGLPSTNVDNFTFFANGVLIEKTAIISFVDNGGATSTLTIDPSQLSYGLSATDEVIGIGKFNT